MKIILKILCYCILVNGILCTHRRKHSYYDSNAVYNKLRLLYSWKSLEFAYPNDNARSDAIKNKKFIPRACIPIDVDVARVGQIGQRVFVTIPRFQAGVPATLGYILTDNNLPLMRNNNPIIVPYPNWERQQVDNCKNLISVFRIKADECNRLWILDTGKVIDDQICPPKLVKIDLNTERSTIYEFPSDQYKPNSLFITPLIDVRDYCHNTYIYIADVTGFQLIVYDDNTKKSWNIENNLFYPYPDYGSFTIAGQNFNLMDGIFGLALGPMMINGDRMLYFHSLASIVEGYVPTSVVRNSSLFHDNNYAVSKLFRTFQKSRPSQAGAEAMDNNGILFYGLMSNTAIGCWNSQKYPEFGGNNLDILVVDYEKLQFASGLKIMSRSNGKDEIWIITVSFQKVMTDTLNLQETNFRIQATYVDDLIYGSKCAPN